MNNSFEKYLPWFILREIPLLGNKLNKKLINKFQTPEIILQSPLYKLKLIENISAKTVDGILNHKRYLDAAKKELDLVLKSNIKIVSITDPLYPILLKQIPDPPAFLTYLGQLDNTSPCISVVGSRNATSYGLSTSYNLSYNLSKKGFQIVSGLARGIDSMAHRGALMANQKTIAVLGSGLNKIYPRENKNLFNEIAQKGTVFSEFKVNTDPYPSNFPRRNRIIAGLSCGSIIVEAAQRSGSLITARLANEFNREVFAVPGSIKSKKSQGTHFLLKQGAKLVENEMDIIDELHHFIHADCKKNNLALSEKNIELQQQKKQQSEQCNTQFNKQLKTQQFKIESKQGNEVGTEHEHKAKVKQSLSQNKSPGRKIIDFLEPYPIHIDEIIVKTDLGSSKVISQLLDLELEGCVIRHKGDYYSISEENH